MLILGLLALFVVSSTQELKTLEPGFQANLKALPGSLMFDAGSRVMTPVKLEEPPTSTVLRKLAASSKRVYEYVGGVSIFRFPKDTEASSVGSSLVDIVGNLPDDALKEAFGLGLSINELPKGVREDLIASLASAPNVADELSAGGARAMVKFCIGAVARVQLPSGESRLCNMFSGGTILSPRAIKEAEAKKLLAVNEPVLDGKSSDKGPLSFPEGELAKLSLVLEKAGTAFRSAYKVDPRLADEVVFVRGSFSKGGFEQAISAITDVARAKEVKASYEDQFKGLLSGRLMRFADAAMYQPKPDFRSIVGEPTYTGAELKAFGGEAATLINQLGIPSDAKITLVPVLYLGVDGGTPSTRFIIRLDPRKITP